MLGQKLFHFSNLGKRKTLFSFLILFSVLVLLAVFVTMAQAADFEGNDFDVSYAPESLGVGGGANDSYNVVTIQAKVNDVKTLLVTFDLPDGVSYVSGTVEMTDSTTGDFIISEHDVSDPSSPVFKVLNTSSDELWNTGDFVTFRFKRTANCDAVTHALGGGVFKDYASLSYDKNGAATTATDTVANTGTYSLLYTSLSLSDIDPVSGNIGDTFSRSIVVTNGGNAGTSSVTHEVWPGASVIDYKLFYNGTELTPTVDPNDGHLIYSIDMTAAPFSNGNGSYENGDGNLTDGESLIFTESFKITECGSDSVVYHQARWDCQTTQRKAGTVLVDSGNPNLKVTVDKLGHNVCGSNHFKVTIKNTATGSEDWARDVLLNLGFGANGDLLNISYDDNNRWAFDCRSTRSVSNFMVNGQPVTPDHWEADYDGATSLTDCGSDWTYAILHNSQGSDIDGSGGLTDIDGDGFYDDLPPGESVTFEFDSVISMRENCGTGRYDYIPWEHMYFNALAKNQCGNAPIVKGKDLEYANMIRDENGLPLLLESPTDVEDDQDFKVSLAPSLVAAQLTVNNHPLLNDSPDSELAITITVPSGVSLPSPPPAGYTQNGNQITWSTTDVESRYLLGQDFSERFLDFPLVMDCTDYLAANNGTSPPIVIGYKTHMTFDDSTGNACLERDIHCGQFPPIAAHCPTPCAGPSITKFDSHRITAGWTDSSMTTRVDLSDTSTYNVDYYLAGDEMQIDINGEMGNLTADNLHFVFTYTTDGDTIGQDDLVWLNGTLHYYDASTGQNTSSETLSAPTVTASGDTYTVEFDLPLDSLGGQVTQDDKFYLELHYKINKDLPYVPVIELHQLSEFRGLFYVDDHQGNDVSCESWGDNVYYTGVYATGVQSMQFYNTTFQNCEESWLRALDHVYSRTGDIHPNEFRPPYEWNYTRVQLPEGVDLLDVRYAGGTGDYYQSTGDIDVTAEANNTYLLKPVPGKVTLRDHHGTWYPAIYLKLRGSCATAQDISIKFLEHSSNDFVYLPGEEVEKLSNAEGDVTYHRPTYTMEPATAATLAGNEPYADFDIKVQNTSSTSIAHHWIYMPSVSGIDVDSVWDVSDPANPVSLTMHEDTDGSVWAEIGALAGGESKTIRFHAAYSICTDTPVEFSLGFSCSGYPTDFAAASSCDSASTTITLLPSEAEIQFSIVDQPVGTVDNCTTFTMTYEFNSAQTGTVVDPRLRVTIPGGVSALQVDSVTIEYPRNSGNVENVTLPLTEIDANTVEIPITHSGLDQYGGLPGLGVVGADVDPRKATLSFGVQTRCGFPSNSPLTYTTLGNRTCGNPATGNGVTTNSSNIVITGMELKYYALSSTLSTDDEIVACGQDAKTLTVSTTIVDVATDDETGQTGDSDYSKVILPPGFSYVDNSFQSTGANAVTLDSTGADFILVKYPAGLQNGDTTEYKFDVIATSSAECAQDVAVKVENYVSTTSTCGDYTCTDARIITGRAKTLMDVIKPALSCNNSGQASMEITASGADYNVQMTVSNIGTVALPASSKYKIYCADPNGQLLGSALYTGTTTSDIGVSATYDIDDSFSSSTVCSTENGMVMVWDKEDGCQCDILSCPMSLTVTNMVAIGNRVWSDDDEDGTMNGEEEGIDGVTVELYKDANGNGECEPGGADGAAIASTTTSGGGFYYFLGLTASNTGDTPDDKKTHYCVAIPSDTLPDVYEASSAGWTQNPDLSDENPADTGSLFAAAVNDDSQQGDDGYPSGAYIVTKPLKATLNGQQGADRADAIGYLDKNSYFTVDFGFIKDDANVVALKTVESPSGRNMLLWGISLLSLGMLVFAKFLWRRQSI